VVGDFNQLNHNQGGNNGGHGVFAVPFSAGAANGTDGRNYGHGNAVDPQCTIDGTHHEGYC
jgi:hypothetical protein